MSIKERDIKLLWGRSGGRCAFADCRRRLCEDKANATESFPLGEQAHIVAEEDGGPRGKSVLTRDERNSYANLILLCPTHHVIIDKNTADYPVERLHLIKREHELHVERTTSGEGSGNPSAKVQVDDLIYASLVDDAVQLCRLSQWSDWTSSAMATKQRMDDRLIGDMRRFRERLLRAVWPGTNDELERSLQTLAIAVGAVGSRFQDHARLEGERWVGHRFYKTDDYNPIKHERLLRLYNEWTKDIDDLIFLATRAANWMADVVRRDINPMFFALEGRFLLHYQEGLSFTTSLHTFKDEEKRAMPAPAIAMETLMCSREPA